MPSADLIEVLLLFALVLAAVKPVGIYLQKVFSGERTFLQPVLGPIERLSYRFTCVDPCGEMTWVRYATSVLVFSGVCFAALYALLRTQAWLPLNPARVPNMPSLLAFNTAMSFVTNTNWQAYAGETQVSYLTQMIGLAWQNFVSAGVGISVAVALVRGLTRVGVREIGNFWTDLTRSILYVLLPMAFVMALVLLSQGVVQSFSGPVAAHTIEGNTQAIPLGPVASQEAIKELGTNGGGFFNANSAHPFENPTPFTNFLEALSILVIPAGLTYMFGRFAGDTRQGWVLFSAMFLLFALSVGVIYSAERSGNPNLSDAGVSQSHTEGASGGNMEGKDVRFGITGSSLFAATTTAASCGAVNLSMDSLTPIAGGMAILNIALGEVIFGGVGSGLYGILVFAIISVFIAGLLVGRTPEYLGKKIGPTDMKLSMLAVLALEAGVLVFAGISVVVPAATGATLNAGPHGLTELLYAATSAVGNNGSAFGGLNAAGTFFTLGLGVLMFIGRFFFIVPVLAIAGSMAMKKVSPPSPGTFPTNGGLFVGLLIGVIIIVGALTFFPVYALGPVLEQFLMHARELF